jgi:hypothetical protein
MVHFLLNLTNYHYLKVIGILDNTNIIKFTVISSVFRRFNNFLSVLIPKHIFKCKKENYASLPPSAARIIEHFLL